MACCLSLNTVFVVLVLLSICFRHGCESMTVSVRKQSQSQQRLRLAPETTPKRFQSTQLLLDQVYGRQDSEEWHDRRVDAIASSLETEIKKRVPAHELVFGELGLSALVTILDAVGVYEGDEFLDIGAGDGLLVQAAALLFPQHLAASRGIEIVPELYERSLKFHDALQERIREEYSEKPNDIICPEVSLTLGNVYEESSAELCHNTTLALCFATTWSGGMEGRKVPQLSSALGVGGTSELQSGARLVIVDGVLDHKKDGFHFEGELKFTCPDTAPYSIARLYVKK